MKQHKKYGPGDLVKLVRLNNSHNSVRGHSDSWELRYYLGEVGETISGGPNVFYVKVSTNNKLGDTISGVFRLWLDEIELVFAK